MSSNRNLKLLSFGEEEEDAEDDGEAPVRKFKSKSSHDLTDDPTLSAVPAVETDEKAAAEEEKRKEQLERIQSKLQSKGEVERSKGKSLKSGTADVAAAATEEYENSDDEKKKKAQQKL